MSKTYDFTKVIDDEFWKHITTATTYNDVVNWSDISKPNFLTKLSNSIQHFEHHFQSPEYIYFSKDNGILRRVKAYNIHDTCIYYFCIKSIQSDLIKAIKSVENIYGGFRMSPDLRMNKEKLERLAYNPEYESFAKYNFRKEWGEYQTLAHTLSLKNYSYYIHIDIAHFYDDINIEILENNVKNTVDNQSKTLDLLFYFLKNSDKKDLGYIVNNTGLPQEEVGEMSRLLANFYLHQFDVIIHAKIAKEINVDQFIFTRYADDMWIAFNGDETDAQRIIQEVSAQLLKIKLHINEKKLKIYSKDDFDKHWYFDVLTELPTITKDTKRSFSYLFNLFENRNGRWFTPFFYILKAFVSEERNVIYIEKAKSEQFLDMLLDIPTLVFKSKDLPQSFFHAFFVKFPELKDTLKAKIHENRIIHPNQEFFIINLISQCCLPKDEAFELLYSHYFKCTRKYYQWYSRALCISFFLKNSDFLEQDRQKRDKIIAHIANAAFNHNYIERRYNINLLFILSRSSKAEKALKEVFNEASDKAFLQYLKDNN